MLNEDWKLGVDVGRIVGLGLVALTAAWLYGTDMCDDRPDRISAESIICLLDPDACD